MYDEDKKLVISMKYQMLRVSRCNYWIQKNVCYNI